MGSVYLARDLTLNRDVAIKFISPDKTLEPIARERLVREAKAAAGLDHPNICSVYDVIVEPGGRAAIVMQYVKGASLADILRVGPTEPGAALAIATDVARALAAAHAQGIVHRDVKPANIMVMPDGRAKLLDFGVARYDDMSAAAQEASTTTALTSTGLMIGTPSYMSPEQAQKRPLDGRSDLFALGCVLFECLTGTRPFKGHSPLEVLAAILHQQPPIPSSIRSGVNTLQDALCLKLLEKDPEERFQSADELIVALNRLTRSGPPPKPRPPFARWLVPVALVVVLAGAAVWRWGLTPAKPNAAAAGWYQRGIDSLRDGSYYGARLALDEATRADPSFVDGWIRLAETDSELDESDAAQRALLTVNQLVGTEWLMSREQRTRMDAVRAMILRDVDVGVQKYRSLVSANRRDAGAWLDLGRAQEAASFAADARASYETAIGIDSQYAAAHLRRATILALEGQRDKALDEFSEAERLYDAQGPNIEGEVETLIRRGTALNARGEAAPARAALTKATQLAATLKNRAQPIRAQLQLSSVTAWEGKWDEAERMATGAVESALHDHLESVAADGLVDLSTVLIFQRKTAEAGVQIDRAIQLAENRGATRIAARARLQQAALELERDEPARGIAAAEGLLPYFRDKRYRRYELTALSIIGRGHERLRQYAEAERLAQEALGKAVEIKDHVQEGMALENLAGPANAVGALPEALKYRARETEIHRTLGDVSSLPFDLVNQADLLIRIGRGAEGAQLLDEVDAAIAKGAETYLPRARRVRALRALDAAIQGRAPAVHSYAADFPPAADGTADFSTQLAELVLRYAEKSRIPAPPNNRISLSGSPGATQGRELRYWDLAGRLARGDVAGAMAGAGETLADDGARISYEFEWRAAAIGAAAARQLGDTARAAQFSDRAQRALDRLRREWKQDAVSYEARPDLQELRRKAGLTS
jgi:Tfp pilus assembly protein PilF